MKSIKSGATTQANNEIEFTRINNDVNGNPRYVFHFLDLCNEGDNIKANASRSDTFGITSKYQFAVNKAHEIGGRKFHNKQYGGGIVIQSYNTADDQKVINELREVNTNFKKDWTQKEFKAMDRAIYKFFSSYKFKYTTNHKDTQELNPFSFEQIDALCGLAYTSSGAYAGLWICNGIELKANDTHRFIGFAINEKNQFVAICEDYEENTIYIQM